VTALAERIRVVILILFFFMRKSGSHPDEATSRTCVMFRVWSRWTLRLAWRLS